MHVLYLYQHFSTRAGSTGTRAYEMAQHLVAQGHTVTMVCGVVDTADTGLEPSTSTVRGSVDGIDVLQLNFPYSNRHNLTKRAWNFIRYSVAATRLALTEKYDVLFATSTPLTAAIPGIVMKTVCKSKAPFVFEVRDVWADLPIAVGGLNNKLLVSLLRGLETSAYRSADVRIGLAPGICETIDARAKGRPGSVLIPNGADTELFRPSGAQPHGPLRAVFTGTHGIANGLDAVLDAAQVLKRIGRKDIELHFIGAGGEKQRLVERADRDQLDNCFFHDPMPKVDLATALPAYDVGLMILANIEAFYYGTSPNKFFDYLAAGLPVINNYPGWLADLIQSNECGIAVQPDDPEQLAAALEQLADDSNFRAEAGQSARQLAEREFGRGLLAERFVDTLVQSTAAP